MSMINESMIKKPNHSSSAKVSNTRIKIINDVEDDDNDVIGVGGVMSGRKYSTSDYAMPKSPRKNSDDKLAPRNRQNSMPRAPSRQDELLNDTNGDNGGGMVNFYLNDGGGVGVGGANVPHIDRELYLKEYKRARKKSLVISKYLDEETKQRLEQLKFTDPPVLTGGPRRHSLYDMDSSLMNNSNNKYNGNMLRSNYMQDYDEETQSSSSSYELNNNSLTNNNNNNHSSILNSNFRLDALKAYKTPNFASTLSRDAQYALIQSLEDALVQEIEFNFPELRDKIPRTSTAQYRRKKRSDDDNRQNGRLIHSARSNMDQVNNNTNNPSESKTAKPLSEAELEKQLVITRFIEMGMQLLDDLRKLNQRKSSRSKSVSLHNSSNGLISAKQSNGTSRGENGSKKIQFDNKVDYSNKQPQSQPHQQQHKPSITSLKTNPSQPGNYRHRASIASVNSQNSNGKNHLNVPNELLITNQNDVFINETNQQHHQLKMDIFDRYLEWREMWTNDIDNI